MTKVNLFGILTGFVLGNLFLHGFLFPSMGIRTVFSPPPVNPSKNQ